MHLIYSNSHLTVSAVWGADDSSGLFSTKDVALVAPTVVHLLFTTHDAPKPYRYYYERSWSWSMQSRYGINIQRDWCVQESVSYYHVFYASTLLNSSGNFDTIVLVRSNLAANRINITVIISGKSCWVIRHSKGWVTGGMAFQAKAICLT
jgi:hypothetical protein